ncbi:MAPEG family protein [Rhizobium sp. TRM95796]|uniref:MAPEG family protein n=1 Tax=Rhizobium sp. TRM95796 TaxID=2979862 RepID=UPI0021E99487|nr:MAPEG family protein [Rhizobium sp. TRM95796]MCV3767320.1 MAPEG family protein [Rhizobium sp. TRM95796]
MENLIFLTFPGLVGLSVVLLVLHIMLQGNLATRELGSQWNAGPRDDDKKPQGKLAGRAERALRNFQETYPAFIGLALALAIAEPHSRLGQVGAVIWFVGRLAYIPLYLFGVSYIRSFAWLVAMAGLGCMAAALLF